LGTDAYIQSKKNKYTVYVAYMNFERGKASVQLNDIW